MKSPRLTPIDKLAEHMANGCPSVIEAAHRMRLPIQDVERLWTRIIRRLGKQAR